MMPIQAPKEIMEKASELRTLVRQWPQSGSGGSGLVIGHEPEDGELVIVCTIPDLAEAFYNFAMFVIKDIAEQQSMEQQPEVIVQ